MCRARTQSPAPSLTSRNGFVSCPCRCGGSHSLTAFTQRIDRIKSTLSSDLDHLFAATLGVLVGGKDHGGRSSKVSEIEKSKLYADVTECLRTYDVLGLWRDAEDVIRREVLRDFVKKVGWVPPSHTRRFRLTTKCRHYTREHYLHLAHPSYLIPRSPHRDAPHLLRLHKPRHSRPGPPTRPSPPSRPSRIRSSSLCARMRTRLLPSRPLRSSTRRTIRSPRYATQSCVS